MKVTVITVAYNSAETIRDTIESVISQDYQDIEYIIIDGGSKDGTQDIVSQYGGHISQFISEPDEGLYYAMNKGLALATGHIVGILNSDDVYQDSRVLSEVVNEFDSSPIDCLYGDLVYVEESHLDRIKRYWKSGNFHRKAFLNGWMPPHPTFFATLASYNAFGYYDTSFRTSADYELMLRYLYKNHCSVSYLNRVIVRMRMGGQSNESVMNRIKGNKEDRRAWLKNGIRPKFYTLTLKPLRKLGQLWSRPGQEG
ncbi:MAG: glycosyltransferase [Flavobacteriales bacterium]|nr:glycosyltransferase [Flavobacteriales bacterium]